MKELQVSQYVGIDGGYALLINSILDVPEWYHETHEMIRVIVKTNPSDKQCLKYLGVSFITLKNWRYDYIDFTEEIYESIARMYEDLT